MWMTILIVAVALILALLLMISMQPSDFRVTRSSIIKAPPAVVFGLVNDFHVWEAWSPWAKLDPNAKNAFEGSASGKGAIFSWAGNKQVGEGRMTIIDSQPPELIRIRLEFLKPFNCTNTAEFTFKPEGGGTHVTWSMFGRNKLIGKIFGLFMNMDKMVGKDFEKGLASIKATAESQRGIANA